ncbi:hypothetical protein NQZ68_038961 [Dissostichus eleginoides]|nr:hypothetical protein NQZ68_038961 [Dissostichus eleginoides]
MSFFLGSASDLAPTATVLLNKEKHEVNLLKERLEWQMKRTEELEKERDFLRAQLASFIGPMVWATGCAREHFAGFGTCTQCMHPIIAPLV